MSDLCKRTGKTCYQSRSAASKAKGNINQRLTDKRPPLTVYRCRACNYWHVGRER